MTHTGRPTISQLEMPVSWSVSGLEHQRTPPRQLCRPSRMIFCWRSQRRQAHTGPRRQPRDSSLAGPHRHSESVPLDSRAVRAITCVAPIVSLSGNVSERATQVSTPWLTGRQYPLAHGPSVQQSAARVAHRPSVPRLRTQAIRAGPSAPASTSAGYQVPAPIVRRQRRHRASVARRRGLIGAGPGLA